MALYLQATVVSYVSTLLEKLHSDQRGQDTIEWAMLGGLIALGIIAVTALMTTALTDMLNGVGDCIDFNSVSPCAPF